jgi:hypothetical protein
MDVPVFFRIRLVGADFSGTAHYAVAKVFVVRIISNRCIKRLAGADRACIANSV